MSAHSEPQVHPGRPDRTTARSEVVPGVSKPKALFLLAAFVSFLLSVTLYFGGDREQGIFVGIWVPSILAAGALLLGRGHGE